jgi:hypothetical protein
LGPQTAGTKNQVEETAITSRPEIGPILSGYLNLSGDCIGGFVNVVAQYVTRLTRVTRVCSGGTARPKSASATIYPDLQDKQSAPSSTRRSSLIPLPLAGGLINRYRLPETSLLKLGLRREAAAFL